MWVRNNECLRLCIEKTGKYVCTDSRNCVVTPDATKETLRFINKYICKGPFLASNASSVIKERAAQLLSKTIFCGVGASFKVKKAKTWTMCQVLVK